MKCGLADNAESRCQEEHMTGEIMDEVFSVSVRKDQAETGGWHNQILKRKVRRAAETGSPFVRGRNLFPH